ncbi:MAG TPA: hypothetical protein ENI20_03585 [Bacteroides sp.]|nr:hypothetical protein [Bacteroides sp.]
MRIFRFEKWFVDVLTAEGDYVIIFHTLTEVFGKKLCFVEVNIGRFEESGDSKGYHFNQKLKLLKREKHTVSTREGDILLEAGLGSMKLSLRDIDLDLVLSPVHHSGFDLPGMRIPETGHRALNWKPLFIKTMVSGKLRLKGDDQQVMGNGYVDYLISTLSPFKVPVRQLYWGRLHSKDCDLTYSYAMDKNGELVGSQMILQVGGNRIQLDKVEIQPADWKKFDPPGISCPQTYTLEAYDEACRVKMNVIHTKPAIISEFVKNTGELGFLRLALLKKISKNPRGIKFFSVASLDLTIDGRTEKLDNMLMIDEYVKFT